MYPHKATRTNQNDKYCNNNTMAGVGRVYDNCYIVNRQQQTNDYSIHYAKVYTLCKGMELVDIGVIEIGILFCRFVTISTRFFKHIIIIVSYIMFPGNLGQASILSLALVLRYVPYQKVW